MAGAGNTAFENSKGNLDQTYHFSRKFIFLNSHAKNTPFSNQHQNE
jgi:hypothetical protein